MTPGQRGSPKGNRPDLVRRLLQPLVHCALLLMLVLTQLSLCRARPDHPETARESEIPPLLSALPPPPPPPAVLIASRLFSMTCTH